MLMLVLCSTAWGQAQIDYDVIDMRSGLPESRVRALCQMPDGRMAIATAGTVTIYDESHFKVYNLPPEAEYTLADYQGFRQLTCDTTGLVWLRNNGSLYVIDTRREQVVGNVDSLLKARHLTPKQVSEWPVDESWRNSDEYRYFSNIINDEISALVRDSYGGLWIGTKENGIIYSNPARKQQFHTSDSEFAYERIIVFRSNRASDLATKYASGATNCTLDERILPYIYLGTRNGVMIINHEGGLVCTLDERDGLSTNNVAALLNDQHGDVWAATVNGLTRIRPEGPDSFSIVSYGVHDGIDTRGREFRTGAIHLSTNGMMTVGFTGGICTFYPDSVTAPRHTFHYPRPTLMPAQNAASKDAEAKDGKESFFSLFILMMLAVIVTIIVALSLVFRKRNKKKGKAKNTEAMGKALIDNVANQKASETKQSADEAFLEKLHAAIEQHIGDEDFSVVTLSQMMAMDRTVLYRRMQTLTGTSPSVYIKNIRMGVAQRLLRETDLPVSEIAYKTGFSTAKYFSTAFKESFGMSPNDYRKGA